MNLNKLKAYAPKARRDFIKAVTDRAAYYGLMPDKIEPMTEQGDVAIIGGKPFPRDVAKKRKRLEERIGRDGFEQVMKARADDPRIFENGTRPHVLAIQETKGMDAQKITEALNAPIVKGDLPPREMLFEELDDARAPLFSRKNLSVKGEISQDDVAQLIQLFEHGKTFGSLIRVPEHLHEKLVAIAERVEDVLAYGEMFGKAAAEALRPIFEQAGVLARKYD